MHRIFLLCVIFTLSSFIPKGYGWQIDIIGDSNTGRYNSMVLDQNNLPHISYSENAFPLDPEYLKIAYYDGTGWQTAVIDSQVGTGNYNSLVLDSDGNPHVAYVLYELFNCDLKYAHYTGTTWIIQTVDSPGDVGGFTSLAIDNSNHPHISYFDNTNKTLKYAYHDGHIWHIMVVEDFNPTESSTAYTSIKVDSENHPHIAYHHAGLCHLKYAYWDGSSWNISNVDGVDSGSYGVSLVLDKNDIPHIAFYDDASLKHAEYSDNQWQVATVDSTPNDFTGLQPSLALNSQGNPCISYEQEYNRALKYAYYANSQWHISVVASPISNVYYESSLALDENDNPHISFCYDGYRLAYAHHDQIGVELAYFTAQPVQAGGIRLGWQTSSSLQGITGFNLYRTTQSRSAKSDWIKLNSVPITGSNPYTFMDPFTRANMNYTYKLTSINASGKEDELGTASGTAQEPPTQFAITSIYPNPATNLLTCSYIQPSLGEVTFTIYDLSGRVVSESHQNLASGEGDAMLEVGSLADGVYILKAKEGSHIISKRFVVNK